MLEIEFLVQGKSEMKKKGRWPITRPRWGRIFALVVVLPLILSYVGSYAYLSRRGMREAETWGFRFFFYVPLGDPDLRKGDLTRQMRFVSFYAPLNWIDRTFFGGTHPCTGMTLYLSKPEQE
jgi:hypothetical protein